MSQKEALEKDPYLLALYHRKGSEIIHEFKALALVREYFDQLGNFMSFGYPGNTNAFSLMQWASEMLSLRMYEFHLDITKLTKELKKKIVYGEVIGIKKTKTTYIVDTKDRQYQADNVVVATEPWVTRELIQLDSTSPILMSAYVRHVMGIPSKQIKSTHFTYILFPSKSGIISINRQADGSYLIYTDSKDISIDKYFESHEIIYERPWDPAFIFSSKELIEAKHDKGLYLIGGINIESMEDCATTGIWAARQILRSQLSL
ncbi:hypothetical protein KBD59_05480 [Candidatus Gracilibacteria bacterium]|nr:hypothetical protein [Candidatus Gracilibacteria bacterium]